MLLKTHVTEKEKNIVSTLRLHYVASLFLSSYSLDLTTKFEIHGLWHLDYFDFDSSYAL